MKSIVLLICLSIYGSSIDYTEIWADDFKYAKLFIENQSDAINEVFGTNKKIAAIAISVGFPELIRYNAFKDFFETKSLEIAYVEYGLDAVDFSIGEFQMKPSFAEAIENEINGHFELSYLHETLKYSPTNKQQVRRERIARLKNTKWQFIYLKAFTLYMMEKYPDIESSHVEFKVAFLASAYNYGFQSPYNEIENWSKVHAFPHGLKANVEQYAYSDIALFYFRNFGKGLISSN